jgi:hypothetical protein
MPGAIGLGRLLVLELTARYAVGGRNMEAHPFGNHLTRYATNVRFQYRYAAETTYRHEGGWIRDLNSRGAWVELPERVAAPGALAVALETPEGELPLAARVAWTYPGLRDAPYLHGLVFTDVTPDRRHQLRTLLAHDHPLRPVRLYCRLAASCERNGGGGPVVLSAIRDLSDNGVGLRMSEPVPTGTEVCIRTTTPFGNIVATAKVVWAEAPAPRRRGASYRHGLRILRLDPASARPLQALLEGVR